MRALSAAAAIKTAMTGGIEKGLGAIYIFILIGVLIAALIEGRESDLLRRGLAPASSFRPG